MTDMDWSIDEDYLEDEDFNDIRFYRRHGNVLEGIENATEKYATDPNDKFFSIFGKDHHRDKRTVETVVADGAQNLVIPWEVTNTLNGFMCIKHIPVPCKETDTTPKSFLDAIIGRKRKKREIAGLCNNSIASL